MHTLALLALLLLPARAHAVDVNAGTFQGNVWSVMRTNPTGYASRVQMTIATASPSPIGQLVYLTIDCTPAMGCWDSWWLSSRCSARYQNSTYAGGTFETWTCIQHSAQDGGSFGACVSVPYYLWSDPGPAPVVPIATSVDALPASACSSKPSP